MKLYSWLLCLLLFCSCGRQNGYSTAYLRQLIGNFEADFDQSVGYSILFVKQFSKPPANPNQVGVCVVSDNIFIPRYIEILSKIDGAPMLPVIVYHEMGHCSLNLKHYDKEIDIMNTYIRNEVILNFQFYKDKMISNYNNNVYP